MGVFGGGEQKLGYSRIDLNLKGKENRIEERKIKMKRESMKMRGKARTINEKKVKGKHLL